MGAHSTPANQVKGFTTEEYISGFHPGFFNWGGGGSSISANVQPPTLHEVGGGGGGGNYASTDLIGPVGSARLVLQFMAVR